MGEIIKFPVGGKKDSAPSKNNPPEPEKEGYPPDVAEHYRQMWEAFGRIRLYDGKLEPIEGGKKSDEEPEGKK
ncbi:MAG TPA: hypothetical protein ENJ77_01565 [Candidatus Moranbacteria bacterium]|nr:hypothetical protein [Candidatus Moranbacteria bacterium]